MVKHRGIEGAEERGGGVKKMGKIQSVRESSRESRRVAGRVAGRVVKCRGELSGEL